MSYKLVKSSNFNRSAKKLSRKNPDFLIELKDTLELLCENVYDKKLKTHKLKGSLKDCWACSINFSLRIVFIFVIAVDKDNGTKIDALLLLTIGTHDEVY